MDIELFPQVGRVLFDRNPQVDSVDHDLLEEIVEELD